MPEDYPVDAETVARKGLPDSEHKPAVMVPNSMPTGSRFGTSTESYAMGLPDSPSPSWVAEAVQRRRQRLSDLRPSSNESA